VGPGPSQRASANSALSMQLSFWMRTCGLFSGAHLLDPVVSWIGIACVFFLTVPGPVRALSIVRDLVSKHVGSIEQRRRPDGDRAMKSRRRIHDLRAGSREPIPVRAGSEPDYTGSERLSKSAPDARVRPQLAPSRSGDPRRVTPAVEVTPDAAVTGSDRPSITEHRSSN
jgi:hypothetical protein